MMLVFHGTLVAVLTAVCVIAANESTIQDVHNPAAKVIQLGAAKTDSARQARVLDLQPDTVAVHAEYRTLQSDEAHDHDNTDGQELSHESTRRRDPNVVNTTKPVAHVARGNSVESESVKQPPRGFVVDKANEKNEPSGSNQVFARRMDYVEDSALPAKEIISKPLHFSKQDQITDDVVLYRPKSRSRDGYQRSRILVQKNVESDQQSDRKQNTDMPAPTGGTSGRVREVHRGKSLFYDSSAELVGMASGGTPDVVRVETRVLPDACVDGPKGTGCRTSVAAEGNYDTTTSTVTTKSPFETRVAGEHPEWTTVLSAPNATDSGIRLAKTMLHYDSTESEASAPAKMHVESKNDLNQVGGVEAVEPRSDSSEPARGRNRATSGRSLFKLLAAGSSNNNRNETTTTGDKESKMSPFRFGLQQLFTPRLPVALPAYPQMITYAPQYPAGSLLYPTRAPLMPLYTTTTTGLLPTAAHLSASTGAAISTSTRAPSQNAAAQINGSEKGKDELTATTAVPECPGECVDVFAALMCGQVDEDAHCPLSNQRCCVSGSEQVSKFLKRHGSLVKKKKKHTKKYQKKHHRNKESTFTAVDNGGGHTGSVEIAIEEGGHQQGNGDVQKIFVHSTSATSSAISKGSTTRRPALIQLSSGNGVLQVIGSKDQLWTTRYPEIPKYVTIVTTTRRPHKLRQHATRRMDSYSDGQTPTSALAYESQDNGHNDSDEFAHIIQEEKDPVGSTRKPKHQHHQGNDQDNDDDNDNANNGHRFAADGPIREPAGHEHELEMIESGVHEVTVQPPFQRKSKQKTEKYKKNQKPPLISTVSEDNHIDEGQTFQDHPEEGTVDEPTDANADGAASDGPPRCPGNCVMPLFSLFCDPEFKVSHTCDTAGRVCCVGASTKPNDAVHSEIADETTSSPTQSQSQWTPSEDDGHDKECSGRCVTAFFQYTCRHPFKITDDICPLGSLCCSESSASSQLQANMEDNRHGAEEATKESNEQHGAPVNNDAQADQQQQPHDAAESAKNKLNLIHSILTTVLSTKRPKIRQDSEHGADDTPQRVAPQIGSRPLSNFIDEALQLDETRLRPNYAAPYEPKYFPTNDAQTQGSSVSEENSDPPEVVIEPAIPTRPALDTSFSQLDRPPPRLAPSAFTPFNNRPFHGHHRAPHMAQDISKDEEIDPPPLRHRGYPRRPESPHMRPPPSTRQAQRHYQGMLPGAQPDDDSPENSRMRPLLMGYRGYPPEPPPYRRFRPPPHFLRPNSSSMVDLEHSYPFEDDLLSRSREENNNLVHEPESSFEETGHTQSPELTAPSTPETPTERNYTSPFVSEWTPTDVNVARVKEVNAMAPTQSEEMAIKLLGNGVHPSSCGLNGFHIKRGPGGQRTRTAKPGEWCWQAAIVDSDNRLLCSGAVIGAQWILTSASCLARANFTSPVSPQTSGLRAKIGYVDLTGSAGGLDRGPIGAQTKTVSMVYTHHNFNAERRDNDIALLKLHDFIDLNGVVCVICLPSTIRPERAVENCTVTAYRYESPKGTAQANQINVTNNNNNSNNNNNGKVKLTYERVSKLDPQVCADLMALRNYSQAVSPSGTSGSIISRSTFCAGDIDKAERTATCNPSTTTNSHENSADTTIAGDVHQTESRIGHGMVDVVGLGNPLVCRVDDEFYQLSGLSSMFLGCTSPASPTVFTNLAYFTGWINQITNVNRYS